jgi:vanillate O-demethylase monooxygenase subunit
VSQQVARTNPANTNETPEERIVIAGFPSEEDVPENMAPMIRNCWYVMAELDQVNRELKSIEVLGQPLVYYRTEAGEPVVLDDRCAHRRFALSQGVLIGDSVRCGYHGFTYNDKGRCVKAPGFDKEMAFGVRKYPCEQRGPWLWVWMGEPSEADPSLIPLDEQSFDPDRMFLSYKHNPGNYMLLIENLLDLTHIPFLHSVTGQAEDWADQKLTPLEIENGTGWEKNVDKEPAGMISLWTGGNPENMVKSYTNGRQHGPSLNDSISTYEAFDENSEAANPSRMYIAHGVTPQNERGTHQFTLFYMSHPLQMPKEELRALFENNIYEDDAVAIRIIQENLDRENREGRLEFGTTMDRFGLKMRKVLAELKQKETKNQ